MRLFALVLLLLSLQGGELKVFPPDNPWNWDISGYKVHPQSDEFVKSIGPNKPLHPDFGSDSNSGIPYVIVSGKQKKVPIEFEYKDESDPGPYPIPDDAPIEGGAKSTGDRHVLVVDRDTLLLYELFSSHKTDKGWKARSGAMFNLKSNDLRKDTWTSADAAGLPIFPGLVRYDEVAKGVIPHAIRFTVVNTRKAHIWPARHDASSKTDARLPPMGLRFRLKAGVDISRYPKNCQVILQALKTYGMILADNGSDWFISGAPDKRWKDDELNQLKKIKGSDFEVVQTVDDQGNPIYPKKK